METISRKEAKEQGLKFYFTGKECKHGHISTRYTNNGQCVECSDQWSKQNPEKSERIYKRYRSNNIKRIKQRCNQHYQSNVEQYKERVRRHQQNNPEQCRRYFEEHIENFRKYAKQWRQSHPNKVSESARIRKRNMLVKQKPPWSEDDKINQLYLKRDELNQQWGTHFEVDHIIPLQGKTVSGLHCWANLQLLDKHLNLSKNSSYQQDW